MNVAKRLTLDYDKKKLFFKQYILYLTFKILYAVNIRPRFIFASFTSFSAGKFITGRIIPSLNINITIQIQEGTKLFAIVEE